MEPTDLIKIFDADLEGLLKYRGTSFVDFQAKLYCDIMIAYFSGDADGIESLLSQIAEGTEIKLCATARYHYRNKSQDISKFWLELETSAEKCQSIWRGEMFFILSNYFSSLNQHEKARDYSHKAFHELKRIGAKKKGIRSLMNALASQSCIIPDQHYLVELNFILKEAELANDSISVGNTLINISRVYQKVGAHLIALKFANKAVEKISDNLGSENYFLALAHRCEVLCEMDAFFEAKHDAQILLSSQLKTIQSALHVLANKFPKLELRANSDIHLLTPGWKERMEIRSTPTLSQLEQKLLSVLARRSCNLQQIGEALYGNKLPWETIKGRVHNLLIRFRKKNAGLIIYSSGKYRLAENPTFLPMLKKAMLLGSQGDTLA